MSEDTSYQKEGIWDRAIEKSKEVTEEEIIETNTKVEAEKSK